MLFANVGHKVVLAWVVQSLLKYPVSHVLFSDGEAGYLFFSHELNRSVRVGLHHLSSQVWSAFYTPLLVVFNHPLGCLEKRPKFDFSAQLLSKCWVSEPNKAGGDLFRRQIAED